MSARLNQPRFGLDYAWTTISPSAHRAVGSSFACRYVSYDDSKDISRSEADQLRSGGISPVAVWETSANRALAGYGEGQSDARAAIAKASAAGITPHRPIYFAVDFDTNGNPGATDSYFDGVASVMNIKLCGPYGGKEVVTHHFNRGFGFGWQTYAWSGGQLDTRAQIYQYSNDHVVAGSSCDFDHAYFDDFGQWDYQPPAPPDPYALFANSEFAIADKNGRVWKFNEHNLVRDVDHWLKDPKRNARALKDAHVKINLAHRRLWTVAHWDATNNRWLDDKHATWGKFNRGARWQELVKRDRALDKLFGKVTV